jgi:hypothetical protein
MAWNQKLTFYFLPKLEESYKIDANMPSTSEQYLQRYNCKQAEWEAINHKQIARWQHVSRLKASSFGSW